MAETSLPTHRFAIISFVCALLTLFSFCVGVAPIPLTGWVCFPAAILFGLAALLTGLGALIQIRSGNHSGRWIALAGALLGGFTILATLCAILLTISLGAAFVTQLLSATPTIIPISTPQAP